MYVHIYACLYVISFAPGHVCVRMRVFLCVCTHLCAFFFVSRACYYKADKQMYKHTHTHAHTHTHTHTRTHTHTHTRTHAHAHTHIYIYVIVVMHFYA